MSSSVTSDSRAALRQGVLACIGETLMLEPQDLEGEPQFGMTPGWDSMGHMNLVVALEGKLNKELPLDEIPSLTSATAIVDYLTLHNLQLPIEAA